MPSSSQTAHPPPLLVRLLVRLLLRLPALPAALLARLSLIFRGLCLGVRVKVAAPVSVSVHQVGTELAVLALLLATVVERPLARMKVRLVLLVLLVLRRARMKVRLALRLVRLVLLVLLVLRRARMKVRLALVARLSLSIRGLSLLLRVKEGAPVSPAVRQEGTELAVLAVLLSVRLVLLARSLDGHGR